VKVGYLLHVHPVYDKYSRSRERRVPEPFSQVDELM